METPFLQSDVSLRQPRSSLFSPDAPGCCSLQEEKPLASGLRTSPQCLPSYLNVQVAFSGRPSGYPESISVPCSRSPSPHHSSVLLQLQFLILILSSQPACTMKTDVLSVLIPVTTPGPSMVLSTWQAFGNCRREGGANTPGRPPLHGLADSEAKACWAFPPVHVLLGECPPALSWACCRPGSPEAVSRGVGRTNKPMPGRLFFFF